MSMTHEITSRTPGHKRGLRKGRGESSGHGKTSGRGTKGAGARVGGPYWKVGHEGGQTPIHRRLPTRGFSNDRWERDWYIVNLSDLETLFDDGATIDAAALIEKGLVPDVKLPIKILGDGTLTRKFTVQVGWYSKSAHAKIIAAGGSALNAKGAAFEFPKPKKRFVLREPVKKAKGEGKAEGKGEAKGEAKPEKKGKTEEKGDAEAQAKSEAPPKPEAPAAADKPSDAQ
jgi:large subunit ribosomal protein L15